MIRIFLNGGAASAGGGLTYLRNVIPQLAQQPGIHTTVLLNRSLRREFAESPSLSFVEWADSLSSATRLFHEQSAIPKIIQQTRAQVLISAGNFALWRSPVPQILLSRNSLYTSPDFARDLRARSDYSVWTDTLLKGWLARHSILRADITIAPSESFAAELRRWCGQTTGESGGPRSGETSGKNVVAIPHGFNTVAFHADPTPLSPATQAQLAAGADAFRLLFVSHYNYYRNFETLFQAMPILRRRLPGKRVILYLTCRLRPNENPGSYRTEAAFRLRDRLRETCDIVELGSIAYRQLPHLYRACHVYVTPAYAESFAHPLVEAMSSGLPVVASDLPVHKEICRGAALYFSRFSPEDLATKVLQVYQSPELAKELSRAALRRSQDFSWEKHVRTLLNLARGLIGMN